MPSNLMRLMIGSLRLEPAPGVPFPPLDIFRETGSLTFEQLASLRHRGAFSTVSLTFTSCCQLTQRLKNVYPCVSGSDSLLREWYRVGTQDPARVYFADWYRALLLALTLKRRQHADRLVSRL